MNAHEILVETRNRVAKGWCRGGEFSWNGANRCFVGQMAFVAGDPPYGDPISFMYSSDADLEALRVDPEVIEARALCAALLGIPPHRLYSWNDRHTKEQVLALLDEAICESAPPPDLSFEFLVTA